MTEDVKLPELPATAMRFEVAVTRTGERLDFTANQMREYARQAVLAERERCATLCDGEHFGGQRDDDLSWTACAAHLAAAIRKG